MKLTVISSTADILGEPARPSIISQKDSQLLYGEQFQVEKARGAYVYGHSVLDGYQGYVERAQLIKDALSSTHFVKVRASHLYPEPSFKSRPLTRLSFMSRVTLTTNSENGFTQLSDQSWIFSNHIAPMKDFTKSGDLAQTAEIYLGTPYLFGGRSAFGIDCAGLVQVVVYACGHACPLRDSCDQEGSFGTPIKRDDVQRNDIVYFKGHVGIMMDDKNILNATARHMTTLIEPLSDLEAAYDGGITHIARL